jgi:hypothetical protein
MFSNAASFAVDEIPASGGAAGIALLNGQRFSVQLRGQQGRLLAGA